ncbi:hypothetical protein [[Eubacterium] cellulosolvens]
MSTGMEESSVQWVLSKDPEQLVKILGMPLGRCLGTEVTTVQGRVDLMFQVGEKGLLVVELETEIDSASKLEHCKDQVQRYQKLKNQFRSRDLSVALVYSKEGTPARFTKKLQNFSENSGIILRSYSMRKLQNIYNKMVNQLNHTSGISLGRAVALGVTSIGWLNKFMLPFLIFDKNDDLQRINGLLTDLWTGSGDTNQSLLSSWDYSAIDSIPWVTIKQMFSSATNFYVLKRLVEDFELVEMKKLNKIRILMLTELGCRFRDELCLKFQAGLPTGSGAINSLKELTTGQQRLLLEVLLNGNFTKLKVNIFHFLRFVHLTEGNWLPKAGTRLSRAECQYLNNILNSSYNSRTLKDLILQMCTFCEELGLVKRLPAAEQVYDNVMFTSLGSRVNNHFEQLLHMERERYQIPLQIG